MSDDVFDTFSTKDEHIAMDEDEYHPDFTPPRTTTTKKTYALKSRELGGTIALKKL
ncbi:uncharacterized protein RHO25_009165 [Cercospora beticola]|uniref:Uncharacterized protein n=1 Tax=Cercospora beticola TaxID=122368 RepID=A0ABZ0NYQ9_CERBT|nr:hypothetical protein RHO25_009165 [Cercospora beticola]